MPDPRGESIKIEGLGKLRRDLEKVDKGLTVEVKKMNFDGAMIVARGANQYVPVGDTGKLAMSIRAKSNTYSASVTAGSPSVPYAAPIHWGWPAHNIVPNKFIYKAFDEHTPEILVHFDAGIKALTELAFAGGVL